MVGFSLAGFALPGHAPILPVDYFDAPLETDLVLAGNFAEMRSNHFHAGLDLKTEGREGLPVKAAAEGWISRIKVSPVGYGNALYVAHPNGYTTVYAHLQRFEEPVASYVRELQYKRKRFDIDVYPRKGDFPVERGALIARSGNSGGSYAPHLHFEVRETSSQTPLNPLLFDFDVPDELPPRIFRVKLYPAGNESGVRTGSSKVAQPSFEPVVLDASPGTGTPNYVLNAGSDIDAAGSIAFGIQAHDYHDRSNNRLGAYRIRLEANGRLLFASTMERVRFDHTRYINAHVDYAEYKLNRRWIQRSHKLPGNRLPIYELVEGGYLRVVPDSVYQMKYTVEDAAGNASTLEFVISGTDSIGVRPPDTASSDIVIPSDEAFTFSRNQLRVRFESGTFYDDQPFAYELLAPREDALSSVHQVSEDTVPLHKSMTISVRTGTVPDGLADKLLLGKLTDEGEVVSAGGRFQAGFVVSRTRSFGTYFVVADTTAPEVRITGLTADGRLSQAGQVTVRVKDDLSGIGEYNAYVDGEWALLQYDPKNGRMIHEFVGAPSGKTRKFVVSVTDNKGNKSTVERSITY